VCALLAIYYHHDLIKSLLTKDSATFIFQTYFILIIILFRWPAWCKEPTGWPKPPFPWTGDWVASPGERERGTHSCIQGGWSCEYDCNGTNNYNSEQDSCASSLLNYISTEWVLLHKRLLLFSIFFHKLFLHTCHFLLLSFVYLPSIGLPSGS
jgi:hypothetical protein